MTTATDTVVTGVTGLAGQGTVDVPDDRLWKLVIRRVGRNRVAMGSLVVLVVIILVALFAPLIAPDDPNHQDLLHSMKGPSGDHWLGTDLYGRDILSRVIY